MKKGQHPTANIQHRTPNETGDDAWISGEGGTGGRKFNMEERLLEFASAVMDLSERPPATRAGNHIAGQILRSGTSPFPDHGEAESAEPREDFIHKPQICLKELRETRRWARLIHRKLGTQDDSTVLLVLSQSDELFRTFMANISTARQNAFAQKRPSRAPVVYPSGETN